MPSIPKILLWCVLGAVAMGLLREQLESVAHTAPVAAALLLAKTPDSALAMPVAHVRRKQVAETWHARRSPNRLHEGEDIFARAGTPVFSATEGIAVRVGSGGLGGNAVSVMGAGGVVYYYAHLSRFADGLHAGQQVTPETLLGFVGNTGNARFTPPHLHFGVYGRAGAIDPLPLLVDRSAPTADRGAGPRRLPSAKAPTDN